MPSFGDWGFVLAAPRALRLERADVTVPTKFLTRPVLREMFVLGRDVSKVPVDISTLDRPAILNYYLHDWKQWE